MARQLTCRVCGSTFAIPEASERGSRGRLPCYCSPACRRAAKSTYGKRWMAANRWRYRRPQSLLTLMQRRPKR